MGTNFYVTEEAPCDKCGRGGSLRHIGKSSAGWCFSLRIYPEDGIHTLDDWKKFWEGKHIENEYGEAFSIKDMLVCITKRRRLDFDWDKAPPPPALPNWVVDATAGRYREAYERICGLELAAWPDA